MVSGSAALLLQVNPDLDQADIKRILTATADPFSSTNANTQGSGRLNLAKALAAARAEIG